MPTKTTPEPSPAYSSFDLPTTKPSHQDFSAFVPQHHQGNFFSDFVLEAIGFPYFKTFEQGDCDVVSNMLPCDAVGYEFGSLGASITNFLILVR